MKTLLSSALLLVLACAALPVPAAAQSVSPDDLAGRLRVVDLDHELVQDLARRHDLSALELLAANWGLELFEPQTRTGVVMPTANLLPDAAREGIVVNRAEYRLYYFKEGRLVLTAPIAIGEESHETPLGTATVLRKKAGPTWFPTASTRSDFPDLPDAVPPGPNNPLGSHALYLDWPTYLIHGAIDEYAIGRRLTRGCVRLYEEDITRLFEVVPVGTPVTIIDQPVKLGWHEQELFLEAYPDFEQLEELRTSFSFTAKPPEHLEARITAMAGERAKDVDWGAVQAILQRRSGMPVQITAPRTHPVNITDPGVGF